MWPWGKKENKFHVSGNMATSYVEIKTCELAELHSELAYLRARIRAITEHAYRTKKGECYMSVQGADGKFRKIQLPEIKG